MRKEVNFNHRIVVLCLLGIAVMVLSLSMGSGWTTSANNDGKIRRHTLKNNAALASPVSEVSSGANEWLCPGEYESHQAMWVLWPVFEN